MAGTTRHDTMASLYPLTCPYVYPCRLHRVSRLTPPTDIPWDPSSSKVLSIVNMYFVAHVGPDHSQMTRFRSIMLASRFWEDLGSLNPLSGPRALSGVRLFHREESFESDILTHNIRGGPIAHCEPLRINTVNRIDTHNTFSFHPSWAHRF